MISLTIELQTESGNKNGISPRNTELSRFQTTSMRHVLAVLKTQPNCERNVDQKCVDRCKDHLQSKAHVDNKENNVLDTFANGVASRRCGEL